LQGPQPLPDQHGNAALADGKLLGDAGLLLNDQSVSPADTQAQGGIVQSTAPSQAADSHPAQGPPGAPGGVLPWLLPSGSEKGRTRVADEARFVTNFDPPVDDDDQQHTGKLDAWWEPAQPGPSAAGHQRLLGAVIADSSTDWPAAAASAPSAPTLTFPGQAPPTQPTPEPRKARDIEFSAEPWRIVEEADRPLVTVDGSEAVGPTELGSSIPVREGQQLRVEASPTVNAYGAEWAFDGWSIFEGVASPTAPVEADTSHREPSITVDNDVTDVWARYRVVSPDGTPVEGLVQPMAWRDGPPPASRSGRAIEVPVTITAPGVPAKQYLGGPQGAARWTAPLGAEAQATAPATVRQEVRERFRAPVAEHYRLDAWEVSDINGEGRLASDPTVTFTVEPGVQLTPNYVLDHIEYLPDDRGLVRKVFDWFAYGTMKDLERAGAAWNRFWGTSDPAR
jgi:hypothetical protein